MSGVASFFSTKNLQDPKFRLKELLIALRKMQGIPLADIAEKIGIPNGTLLEYERNFKPVDRYEAVYIAVLKEYAWLPSKEDVSFEEALKIYVNQKGLSAFNILYKVTTFGNILYEYVYANMNALKEKGALLELPHEENINDYCVWNEKKYDKAFYLLGMLRKMLDIDVKTVCASTPSLNSKTIREFETSKKEYEKVRNIQRILKEYCNFLADELEKEGTVVNLYSIISSLLENEETKNAEGLKLGQLFLNEIYK